ncbi:hypothetical protein HT094_14200 [Shewanella sp. ZOR0012]|nr:hypothetical protein [Shewanella sp. ZOR0012]
MGGIRLAAPSALDDIISAVGIAQYDDFSLCAAVSIGLTEGDRPFYQEMVLQLPRPDLWWPALLEWIGLGSLLSWTVALLLTPPSCIPTLTQQQTLE